MRIGFEEHQTLPKLGWVADLTLSSGELRIHHGAFVERRKEWMVEGVWDGNFGSADFHRAEHFFGSGIRIEGSAVHFVASDGLVDRLVYGLIGCRVIVANSLPLLLGYTGASLDLQHDYRGETFGILKGLRNYPREYRVIHPDVPAFNQLYGGNLVVSPGGVTTMSRNAHPTIRSFHDYVGRLRRALACIRDNYHNSERMFPVSAFSTISSGYDSAAVAALTREIGVRTCFTRYRSNSGVPSWISRSDTVDDGRPVADALGLQTKGLELSRDLIEEDELFFLAASSAEPELVFYPMARHIAETCTVAVVFTGFHGDKVWDVNVREKYLTDVIRGDVSGLNLSEARLASGFVHVPVPFMYARSIRSIVAVASSSEMSPWRLQNKYDRPIPRRILEESGVKREAFGMRKKAVVQFYDYPMNAVLRARFFAWLREQRGISPSFVYVHRRVNRIIFLARRAWSRLRGGTQKSTRLSFRRDVDLPYLMHIWALNTLSARLGRLLRAVNSSRADTVRHPASVSS